MGGSTSKQKSAIEVRYSMNIEKLRAREQKYKQEIERLKQELQEIEKLKKALQEKDAEIIVLELRNKWLVEEHERQKITEKNDAQFRKAACKQQNDEQLSVVESSTPEVISPLIANKPEVRSPATVQLTINQRLAASNVNFVEWTVVDYIHQFFNLSRSTAENLVKFFKENNKTIPFIAHYRQAVTVGMNIDDLKNIKTAYDTVLMIKQKANDFTLELDKQGTWTPEIHVYLHSVKFLEDFKHVKVAYKGHLHNLAKKYRCHGLGIAADAAMTGAYIKPLSYFVNSKVNELQNEKAVRDGIVCILADKINKDVSTIVEIKRLRNLHPLNIVTSKIKSDDKNKEPSNSQQKSSITNYKTYEKFSVCVKSLTPQQITKINQGQAKKILNVRVEISPQCAREFKEYCKKQYGSFSQVSPLHEQLLTAACNHLWEKFLKGFIVKQTKAVLTKNAENALVNEIAKDIKHLLLTPPLKNKVVIGIEPHIPDACRLVVLSENQKVLETKQMTLFDKNDPKVRQNAECTLLSIMRVHKCWHLAIGNDPKLQETKIFLNELLAKTHAFEAKIAFMFIETFGIEDCKIMASREYPDVDEAFLAAICIAKRMINPMDEWVKIETKKLCDYKQQYKNLPKNDIMQGVNEAITEAVSSVGVDLNTASLSLLQRVTGLDESKAKSIIERRESTGPFITRSELLNVPGISTNTYQQCVGFLRVFPDSIISKYPQIDVRSFNYLDQTSVHPEFYPSAEALMEKFGCSPRKIGTKSFLGAMRIAANKLDELAKYLKCNNIVILKAIVDALSMEKGEDVRGAMNISRFYTNVKIWENLSQGAIVNGIVRNTVHHNATTLIGAFVDIGAEIDGYLHRSYSLKTVKSQNLHIGQCIQVKINSFNKECRRIELALIQCF